MFVSTNKAILDNIRKAIDNPNGCINVEKILEAIAVECDRIGSAPFNSMGGYFVWQAIAREIRSCAIGIQNHSYEAHIIKDEKGFATGLKASFNYWWKDQWQEVLLASGETTQFQSGGPDEEGHSWTEITFTHEGDCIRMDTAYEGRDCDGRHESYRTFTCPLDKLASHKIEEDDGSMNSPKVTMTPDWQEVKENSRERDHTAKSMNY